ncbi:ankyrin repeat-containing domain protein [Glomus cerebriforme]|uniref:Ankyrin repeat-containing domain protein n=1 Tax=Glomus cerebriforme TaxID=658196 RepID=A0A397TID0_9GLOM|nr:ankyrin repeat-containing domain protein [Glomus cerebriforme]
MLVVDTTAQTTYSALSEEVIEEIIACARYGELEELRTMMNSYPVSHLELKDDLGNTALHMASANGHLEIVEFIIQALGSLLERVVNTQNDSGNTPLHWSALNGHEKVVELLIKNGANAKIENKAGRTPMYEAQQNNHEKVVEFLLANVDPAKGEESDSTENDDQAK